MSEPVLKDGIPYHIDKSVTMKPYWDGLNKGNLMTTKCQKCGTKHFPPSPQLCTKCYGTKIEWVELPLAGTITTFTEVKAPPEGFFGEYILASVNVDELNKSILGRYLGENPEIGKKVIISFELVNDQHILIFK